MSTPAHTHSPAAPAPRSPAAEFAKGVRDLAPLLVGVVPFGLIYGVLARASGIPPLAAMAMSSVLFAGSSQFMLAQLYATGAPGFVMVATVALVNLRHALYSAWLAPHAAHLPRRWKAALAYLLTDEAYAATIRRYARAPAGENAHWHWLGAGLALWSSWQVATACGIVLGARLPAGVPLDFALPLTFIAIVVPMIRSRAALATALAAAAIALAAAHLPYKLGLMLASLAGIAAGWAAAGALGRRGGSR
jgi:4-azaleucine resistance transporter AzlC